MNKSAFQAYGAFINHYQSHLLKKIFRTEMVDVAALARSFGFSTPPRVTATGFLAPKARKKLKAAERIAKKSKKVTQVK